MTDLVKSLKIGNNRYVIKDSNALPILTSLQRATLLETGNYLDERVLSDTIFETYDGKVEKFIDTITDNSTWNSSTLTATDYWQDIAFGNNTFVATATNRHYAYSTDNGETWSGSTLSGSDLLSVAFGNNKFVLVQKNSTSTAYYSSNGSSWSTTTLPTTTALGAVKYVNDKFIALPYNSTIGMISSNGVDWQQIQLPVSADWCGVAYGNGMYVAISSPHSQDNLASAYSYDGINWVETSLPYYASWSCVTFGAGKFVATGYNTTGAYTLDGINWIRNSMPSVGLGTVKTIYNGDMFVGCDNSGNGKIVYSYDGIKWVVSEMSEKNKWFGIAYGNDTYVMIGFNSNASVYGTISLSHTYTLDSISYNKEDVQHLQEENQSYLKAGTGITINNDSYIPNAVITGNPTINSDVVCSGFSDSNYLSINNLIKNIQTSFELVTAIKLDETASGKSALGIFDSTQEYISSMSAYTGIGIRLTTYNNGSVRLRISNTGDTEYPVDIKGTTVLNTNTKYWVKVAYNTTDGYTLYTSTDGETWTSEGTSAEIVKPFNDTKKYLIGDNASNSSSLPGSIYLKDTYISVDGIVVWKGAKPIGNSVISATSLPSQSGNSGKFLTTDGSTAYWSAPTDATTYSSGYNIIVNPKGVAGYVGSNTSIDNTYTLTCTSTTDACVVLPSEISNLNNSSITSFTLMLKVYVSGTSYSSGQKIFSLFGGKVWSANYQAGIESYGTSKPTITPAQDAWFRVTKSSGTITMEYHLDGETEWTTILSRGDYTSTSWVGDWVLGSPENGSTYNGLKFYLPECYLEIDGVEVWRGYDSTSIDRTINLCKNNGYLKNTATQSTSLTIGGTASTYKWSTNIGPSSSCSGQDSVSIGFGSNAGQGGVALGEMARAGMYGTALGLQAQASGQYAIQIGWGTNSNNNTMNVGLSQSLNVQLLNSSGKIPGDRMSLQNTTAPTTTTAGTIGQFYVDTTNQTGYMCVGIDDTDPNNVIYTWKQITV